MKKIFLGALFICSALLSCTSPELPTAKYQVVPLPQEIIEEAGDGFVLDNRAGECYIECTIQGALAHAG